MELLWWEKSKEHLIHHLRSNSCSFLIGNWVHFGPSGEVVHGNKDVVITSWAIWKWGLECPLPQFAWGILPALCEGVQVHEVQQFFELHNPRMLNTSAWHHLMNQANRTIV